MGAGRPAPASKSARPALSEPVNPTAAAEGCRTSSRLNSGLEPCNREKTPAGIPASSHARTTARAVNSEVQGGAGWAFTMTGWPAASAEAVSPPATEKARGKLLAPKTTTVPMGISIRRRSGFGMGFLSGSARSMVASTQDPSPTRSANMRSCATVRARSPVSLWAGRPVSAEARSISSSPRATISSATASRNSAVSSGDFRRNSSNAPSASAKARPTSAPPASQKGGSSCWPSEGSKARNVCPQPSASSPPMMLLPQSFIGYVSRAGIVIPHGAPDHLLHLPDPERLEQVAERARLQELRLVAVGAGDDYDGEARVQLARASEELRAAHAGQLHVRDCRVEGARGQEL